eukprot:c6946_g1_i1.p1 GENE.c6946_g1_i1~~c6946_g1_i1.p1  ORF type:complete len:475 (+),score=110.06 c6946_g1_i1:113-1537(+)
MKIIYRRDESRVSGDFVAPTVSANLTCQVEGVDETFLSGLSFSLMELSTFSTTCLQANCKQGSLFDVSRLQRKKLFIADLKYRIPGGGMLERNHVFDYLGVGSFEINLLPESMALRITKVGKDFCASEAFRFDSSSQMTVQVDRGVPLHIRENITFDLVTVPDNLAPAIMVQRCRHGDVVNLASAAGASRLRFVNPRLELVGDKFIGSKFCQSLKATANFDLICLRLTNLQKEASRVSRDFSSPPPRPWQTPMYCLRISTPGLSDQHRNAITFAIMQKPSLLHKSICLIDKCHHGKLISVNELANKNNLYIGRLQMGRLAKGEVFFAIGQHELTISICFSQQIGIASANEKSLDGNPFSFHQQAQACNIMLSLPVHVRRFTSFTVLDITATVPLKSEVSWSSSASSVCDDDLPAISLDNPTVIREATEETELSQWQCMNKNLCIGRLSFVAEGPELLDIDNMSAIPLSIFMEKL